MDDITQIALHVRQGALDHLPVAAAAGIIERDGKNRKFEIITADSVYEITVTKKED